MTDDELMLGRMYVSFACGCGTGSEAAVKANEVTKKCVNALNKQSPKTPAIAPIEPNGAVCYVCPNLTAHGAHFVLKKWYNYCPDCGQALDWGEIDLPEDGDSE